MGREGGGGGVRSIVLPPRTFIPYSLAEYYVIDGRIEDAGCVTLDFDSANCTKQPGPYRYCREGCQIALRLRVKEGVSRS